MENKINKTKDDFFTIDAELDEPIYTTKNNLNQKDMGKDSLDKYKVKAKDSFNTKWKLFLFNHVISKSNPDKLTFGEFSKFKIDDNLVQIYSAEYWQKDRNLKLNDDNDLVIDNIYKSLKKLDENSKFKNVCKFEYVKNFEKIFLYTEFLELINEKECSYCKLTIEKVEQLAERKKLFKKNERGWSLEIDRKNSNKEYKKDNCVMSCYWCNNAKTDEFTFEEFEEIGKSFEVVWNKRLKK